jgi:hypothetical protein
VTVQILGVEVANDSGNDDVTLPEISAGALLIARAAGVGNVIV